ncbi:hypothetical protein AVEN_161183-1 [Araneus ventricosus]|uniref:Uncharacterized protein n=1 Tax=Araneus ventricosus TaxID=182803 RepID=A0A4Y2KZJ5_ARAVE|nr:hypothetical protein AVEN_161183-1 [Araneus ventricosus]
MSQTILGAANAAIPQSSTRTHRLRKPWWNEECRVAYRRQRKLWGIFRRRPTTENLVAFKKARALARKVRRRSRRDSWILLHYFRRKINKLNKLRLPQFPRAGSAVES